MENGNGKEQQQLIPPIETILSDLRQLKEQEMESAEHVPEHIAKTRAGIEQYGAQWADQIEAAAQAQLDADTKRYEQAMTLASEIRRKGAEVASNVQAWAMLTRREGTVVKESYARLNGGPADDV